MTDDPPDSLAGFHLDYQQMPESKSESWLERRRRGWKQHRAETAIKRKSKGKKRA